jgi:hypothetical protein
VLAQKLKALEGDLKKWNVEVLGDIRKRKKEVEEGLSELDRIEESRSLTEEEIIKREECSNNLEKTLYQEVSLR